MVSESKDGRQNMHCMEEDLSDTSKNSSETLTETRCDEMEDHVYVKFDNTEETSRANRQKSSGIHAEEKHKVAEVRRLASKKMAENMEKMEETSAEARQVTRYDMAYM